MGKFIDFTGQRFGRLTVLARQGSTKDGHSLWLCRCNCGNEKVVLIMHLRKGDIVSCGCRQKEPKKIKHGMWGTPEYGAYCAAKIRCTNPTDGSWKDYGGRGIKFLFTSFEQFYTELGPRPAGQTARGRALYSIDRKDNDGHYAPGNVRWATQTEQLKNRRRWAA